MGNLIQEGADNVPQQSFISWNDPQGNRLASINRDGSIFCQGIGFVQGGALLVGPVAIVQDSDNQFDSIAPTSLSFTLPATTLYAVSMYYFPHDDSGDTNSWWAPELRWTNLAGVAMNQNDSAFILGPAHGGDHTFGQAFVIPILALGGTAITIDGLYGDVNNGGLISGTGIPFTMDIAIRIVAMP